jgi:Tfp pilus assembly protein PilE
MNHQNIPIILAMLAAIAGVSWYIFTGHSGLDQATRQIVHQNDNVESVVIESNKRVEIKCKNGETYVIIFDEAKIDYNELVFNSCGAEGESTIEVNSTP